GSLVIVVAGSIARSVAVVTRVAVRGRLPGLVVVGGIMVSRGRFRSRQRGAPLQPCRPAGRSGGLRCLLDLEAWLLMKFVVKTLRRERRLVVARTFAAKIRQRIGLPDQPGKLGQRIAVRLKPGIPVLIVGKTLVLI